MRQAPVFSVFVEEHHNGAAARLVRADAPAIAGLASCRLAAQSYYTTLVDDVKVLRLTDNSGDCCPTWSPDSRRIAFVRYSDSARKGLPTNGLSLWPLHFLRSI